MMICDIHSNPKMLVIGPKGSMFDIVTTLGKMLFLCSFEVSGLLQRPARGIVQLSRREFLPFSLMLREENENFCLSVLYFKMRTKIEIENSPE